MITNMSLINLPRTTLDDEKEKETEETRGDELTYGTVVTVHTVHTYMYSKINTASTKYGT